MAAELEKEELEPKRARELIAREGAQVLDLRDDDDFAADHIAGAVRPDGEDIDSALESLEEGQPVVVVCDDGGRSAEVAADLRERGYQAAAVKQGMKGWLGDSMPTIPRDTEEFHGPPSSAP